MDEEFYRQQREMMARVVPESDVVITTAAVPGKQAPVLITAEMVRAMAPGLGDRRPGGRARRQLRADPSGRGSPRSSGVTILGPLNLPATVPFHASQMYARNIVTFLLHLGKQGRVELNLEDEITRETLVTRDGQIANARVRDALGISARPPERSARWKCS